MAAELAPGKWDLDKSENFDEYMKAVGVGFAQRVLGNQVKPRLEITISADGVWMILTTSAIRNVELKFKIGEQFEETTADGRKVQTIITIDGNKLIQEQKGEVDSTIIREFSQDSLVAIATAKGVSSRRYYKRVQ